jgi:hypothetical protein
MVVSSGCAWHRTGAFVYYGGLPTAMDAILVTIVDSLAGNVGDISATCCPNSQMSALLVDILMSWQHKTNPDTVFCVGDCQHSPISSFKVIEVH